MAFLTTSAINAVKAALSQASGVVRRAITLEVEKLPPPETADASRILVRDSTDGVKGGPVYGEDPRRHWRVMYAAIRRFITNGDMDEALRRADVEYTKAVEEQVGFVSHEVIRTGPSEAISVLFFENEEEADRNRFFSEMFIDVGFAGLDVKLVDEWRGEVQVSSASDLALERLHSADTARKTTPPDPPA